MITTYKFNGVQLTPETIKTTRQWYYDNAMVCIEKAKSGEHFVNDLDNYINYETKSAENYLQGKNDNILAFLQKAYYFQTGESVAMLNF